MAMDSWTKPLKFWYHKINLDKPTRILESDVKKGKADYLLFLLENLCTYIHISL